MRISNHNFEQKLLTSEYQWSRPNTITNSKVSDERKTSTCHKNEFIWLYALRPIYVMKLDHARGILDKKDTLIIVVWGLGS